MSSNYCRTVQACRPQVGRSEVDVAPIAEPKPVVLTCCGCARPGLDALRDAAEAGRLEELWCLPDRLARSHADQILVLDELARCGVQVRFLDAPPIADDPQAKLLVQVQGDGTPDLKYELFVWVVARRPINEH